MGNWNGRTELFIEGNPHRPDAHNQARHRIRSLLYLLWHCLVSWQCHDGFLIRQVARGSDCLFDNLTVGRTSSFLLGKNRIKKFLSMKLMNSFAQTHVVVFASEEQNVYSHPAPLVLAAPLGAGV